MRRIRRDVQGAKESAQERRKGPEDCRESTEEDREGGEEAAEEAAQELQKGVVELVVFVRGRDSWSALLEGFAEFELPLVCLELFL
jgi:hypothetical protein